MQETRDEITQLRDMISIDGVREARKQIAPHLPVTPLMSYPLLNEAIGVDVHLKHENHLPTGAFKVRGGINYMSHVSDTVKKHGVVAVTRGNHGQSIALAAQKFGVRSVIVVPHGNNPEKNAAMKSFGCNLIEHGHDYDEARELVEELVQEQGLTYVHSGNEPHLIHGVGTYSLEILESLPEIDTLVIPIGGGSAICGAITVFKALKPEVKIIGVQSANAPSVYESWKSGSLVTTDSANTIADGLATRVPMELPLSIIQEHIDDIWLVEEEEIEAAIRLIIKTTHNLAEGAGAAGLAGIMKHASSIPGDVVATVLSGGNLDSETLKRIVS
jgi:threonine dehydratase